jgi:hypothetical protein
VDSNREPPTGTTLEGFEFERAADIEAEAQRDSWGSGRWYWAKSWECDNPKSAYADLKIGPRVLLDAMYSLVSRRGNWLLRGGIDFLVEATNRKIGRRSVQKHLELLQERGFLVYMGMLGDVKSYLVNPQFMATTKKSCAFRNYEPASRLVAKRAPKLATPVRPKMTRRQQLEVTKQLLGELPLNSLTAHQRALLSGALDDAFLKGKLRKKGEDGKSDRRRRLRQLTRAENARVRARRSLRSRACPDRSP